MEHKIADWLGLYRHTARSGHVLMERSIRLPRVLMIAAGHRIDDAAGIQADLAYRKLRADGWPVGRCNLADGSKATGSGDKPEFTGSRIFCMKQLVRSLPRWDVVHVFVSSLAELISFSMPAVLLGRFFGRKIIVHIYSPHLGEWLDRWGRVIVPVLRQADVVVASSAGGSAAFREYRLKAAQLPALVDCRMFVAREVRNLQPRLIVTRALEPHANPALVLRAFRIVKQKYPRAELLLAGEGSQRQELNDLVERERINGVTFLGAVPHGKMIDHFGSSDLYINGSFRSDIPVSLLEARACGLPVISLGGQEQSDQDEVKNHVDLADRILSLIESPDTVNQLSLTARSASVSSEWSECRRHWTRLYLDLAGRSGQ